jgi:hypothetical protein
MAAQLVALRPEHVFRVLELTDSFNIHREAVVVPLATEKKGSVRVLPDGKLRIVCPNTLGFDEWLSDLRGQLQKMDLSKLRKS